MNGKTNQTIARAKQALSRLSPYLRWVILGGALFFIAKALKDHWQEVTALRINPSGFGLLALAFVATLLAHIWSGWVWTWIMWELKQPAHSLWGTAVFLQTNIAKYLPGNVWHFYGRIVASKTAGFSVGAATLSVVMESLLMAAAALTIALASYQVNPLLQGIALLVVLASVHPRLLNPLMQTASRLKGKLSDSASGDRVWVSRYPLFPFLGEMGFLVMRNVGFLLIVAALYPVGLNQAPVLISGFSLAWVLGLVVPGAPGGLGIFETTAIALLGQQISPAVVLGAVALYRLISTLAECVGAALGWLGRRYVSSPRASESRSPLEKP